MQTDVGKTESLIKELDERRGTNSAEIEALLRECEGEKTLLRTIGAPARARAGTRHFSRVYLGWRYYGWLLLS